MRGGTSCASIGCGRCIVFIRWAFVCLVVPPLQGSLLAFAVVYPGFHIGLCPHFTLGYAGVSPLQGSLYPSSVFPQGFISGFALISPWAMQECRPFRAHCALLLFSQGFISGFALIAPWALQECRPYRAHLCYHHQSITWLF